MPVWRLFFRDEGTGNDDGVNIKADAMFINGGAVVFTRKADPFVTNLLWEVRYAYAPTTWSEVERIADDAGFDIDLTIDPLKTP